MSTQTENQSSESTIMIALYYWYIPIPKKSLEPHVKFHESLCHTLHLFGRIRISKEGLNGVLSGTKYNLEQYEMKLRQEVAAASFINTTSEGERERERERYGETLDVKYCHLRNDVPVEKQMFTSVSVKITQEVVSLNEPSVSDNKKNKRSRGRGRRRRNTQIHHTADADADSNSNSQNDTPSTACEADAANEQSNANSKTSATKPTAPPQQNICLDLDKYEPAKHLTPQEWNAKLLQDAEAEAETGDTNANASTNANAVLIDARNVYESNIGHFSVKGVPTLLTNTRKYSTIPSVLRASMSNLAGKNVYMYCTGGVRCERASVYLQALAESSEWPDDLEKPKSIYQLQGGIQKYLETYGKKDDDDDDDDDKVQNEVLKQDEELCLFAGRNFVFDNRRYDPVVGGDGKAVGRCVLCSCPHDDYDNGNAPCDNKEARCCRCRVLVLVCNNCRGTVRIWGEELLEDTCADESCSKPDLFCGGVNQKCINEGNEVQHCEIVNY